MNYGKIIKTLGVISVITFCIIMTNLFFIDVKPLVSLGYSNVEPTAKYLSNTNNTNATLTKGTNPCKMDYACNINPPLILKDPLSNDVTIYQKETVCNTDDIECIKEHYPQDYNPTQEQNKKIMDTLDVIKAQNTVLILEQAQTNKLLAWNFCKPYSDNTFFAISQNGIVTGDPRVCVDEVMEKTK